VRLITAGRVFRADAEDEQHLKVFHQLDAVCVDRDASPDGLRATLGGVVSAVLGSMDVRYRERDYGWVDQGMDVDVKEKSEWLAVAGCGLLKPAMLRDAGHDPDQVQGYAFGLGLERLAVLSLGLEKVHELWRQPYLQPRP
jgi:phenylalanyl-tRNA synthetase alpha chain